MAGGSDKSASARQLEGLSERLGRLTRLSLQELDDLHYDCEMIYAQLLRSSAKGSDERRRLFEAAYDALIRILAERRSRYGRDMDSMGFSEQSVETMCSFLGPPPARVFDVGCSTGCMVQAMIDRGYAAGGVDLSRQCVEIGRERLRRAGLPCGETVLTHGDFLSLAVENESYDLVHTNDVLEHVHPDEAKDFLSKCHRMLKPGGLLWLITPNRWTGPGDATSLRHPRGARSRGLHLKEYTLGELMRLLRACGFDSVCARLLSGGRFRGRGTVHRSVYAKVKVLLEPVLAAFPPRIRKRPMTIMNYSELVARKASRPGASRRPAGEMNPRRPVLFSFDYPPLHGGVSRLCAGIVAGLAGKGVDVGVLSQTGPGQSGADVPAIRLTRRRPLREVKALSALRREPRDRQTGGPVICGIWYPEGLIAQLAGARPLVILAHGSELMPTRSRLRRGTWRRLLRRVLTRADLVVANSEYTLGLVKESAPESKAVAIPLAVDHERFSPGDGTAAKARLHASGKKVILSVSRIHRYKGHDTVFRALASLPEHTREGLVYLIAGTGADRAALEAESKRLGVDSVVRWLGYVPEADLPDLYRAADLFVLCTREARKEQAVEGFGLVFLEAQGCATPVVGTRAGGIPDAITEDEGGWLIEQDDSHALAAILMRLAEYPAEFGRAGLLARARIERECTWDRYIERFVAALRARGIGFE